MGSKVSQPVRILALVGVLGALALGAGFALLGKGAGSQAEPKVIKPLHPHHAVTVAAKPAVASKPAVAAQPKTKVQATAKAHAKPKVPVTAKAHAGAAAPSKPKARAARTVKLPANGLPDAVNRALLHHDVVVVSLYDPQAVVDAASLGEAQAGAKLANVGFVPLNVLSQKQAEPLAKKLGVLPDPALLVFRRPGDLVFRVNGFADRDTVAQAAANARP
jgi:hypothetical protein